MEVVAHAPSGKERPRKYRFGRMEDQVHGLPVWWSSILPNLYFLGLSFLELCRCTRQTDGRTDRHAQLIIPPPIGRGHNKYMCMYVNKYSGVHQPHGTPHRRPWVLVAISLMKCWSSWSLHDLTIPYHTLPCPPACGTPESWLRSLHASTPSI